MSYRFVELVGLVGLVGWCLMMLEYAGYIVICSPGGRFAHLVYRWQSYHWRGPGTAVPSAARQLSSGRDLA